MYARCERMLGNCAASVVPLPSGASHFPLNVPPSPVANGVNAKSVGLLSVSGAPRNPHTTGPLVVGVTAGPGWMFGATRMTLASAVCLLAPASVLLGAGYDIRVVGL